MLFEQWFSDLPAVNARDLVAAWRPGYGEWLAAHASEGFDRTTTGRYLEEKGVALEEMRVGDHDPLWSLRHDADALSPGALRRAFALKGWTPPAPDHAHAMTETDWKASPWYRKGIIFRPDMTPTRARLMAENFDRRRFREQILARGGEVYNGAGDMALSFGAALLGSLPDPINVIPLGGGIAAARGAGTVGRALWAGARAGAVEGAATTALVDALVLPDLASRGEDTDFADLALDTLAGGVLGSVFGAAGGLLARRAARRGAEETAFPPPAPFDASPDNGFLARAGETFPPGEPSQDFENSLDNGFLERAGQGPVASAEEVVYLGEPLPEPPGPAPLPEGLRWRRRMTELSWLPEARSAGDRTREAFARGLHADAVRAARERRVANARARASETASAGGADAARNAENDLLRQGWTAGNRRAVADAAALGMEDLAEGRPAEAPAVLHQAFSVKKPRVASSVSRVFRNEDTGRGITISHPAGEQGASHMTDSSLPVTSSPVNRPAPDFSTAPEPPAPPRMAPNEARRAEIEALARQDEALRQGMDELEARGAADAGELAGARTDAESTEALGRETLNCAWTAED